MRLRNNILWVDAGYDLYVASDSQVGFNSDYNLLYKTGAGQVGLWQGVANGSLFSWQGATQLDQNSLAQDPLFVDRDGADNILGYGGITNDGRDDDFHEQSQDGSFHVGSSAPVVSAVSGLPIAQPGTETVDSQQSPAIDRGDAAYAPANELSPNGNFINLGAFGNTSQASKSPVQYVMVTRPDGGETWPEEQTFAIRWRSHDAADTVDIQLLQGGVPVLVDGLPLIADDTPNDGEFLWTIPDTVAPGSDYRFRVTRGVLSDTSNADFTIAAPIHIYYVNDSVVQAGDWTTAVGSDANDGLDPSRPKASISSVLLAYDLGPNDVIRVDNGDYTISSNLVVSGNPVSATGDDSGVKIEGYHDSSFPTRRSLLNRNNFSAGSYAFEFQSGAKDVVLDHLSITGAYYGVYAGSTADSDGLTISNSTIYGNSQAGVYQETSSDNWQLLNNTLYGIPGGVSADNQTYGVYLTGSNHTLSGNTIHDSSYGIRSAGGGGQIITGNTVYNNNSSGIHLSSNGSGTVVSGNTVSGNGTGIDYSQSGGTQGTISGNTVSGNSSTGIDANYNVLVSGNTVYGQSGSGDIGINLNSGAAAIQNVVYSNYNGIVGGGSGNATINNNRVYNNSNIGILARYLTNASGNVVY